MRLRKLEKKDALYMLEWMHDENVVQWMQTDFASKTLEDCERFIESSAQDASNLNLAIVDDHDEYMGTVSLKHIDKTYKKVVKLKKCNETNLPLLSEQYIDEQNEIWETDYKYEYIDIELISKDFSDFKANQTVDFIISNEKCNSCKEKFVLADKMLKLWLKIKFETTGFYPL